MAGYNPLQFSLINDEPVTDAESDLLGARDPAQQLAALLVASRTSTPFTLAVDSGWGTGKSSLMRLVDKELTEVHGARTVWYNAWTSTDADRPDTLEGLIKSVLMRFDKRIVRRVIQSFSERRTLRAFCRAVFVLLVGVLGLAPLVNRLWKEFSVSPQARNATRQAIRTAVEERVENGDFSPRELLVVFIDDLDRCSEETVLAVCEAVKVYLDVPGLAFVIGCDRSALSSNGLLRDLSPAGSAFMEKIFQTTFRIPVPDSDGIEDFVRRCARDSGILMLLNEGLVTRIADHSQRNPRRIKKLINGFVLEVGLNPLWRDFVSQAADTVVSALVLQYLYPDFYRMLVGRVGADGDVLNEFQTYRQVRLRLLEVDGDAASDEEVVRFFAEHQVRQPLLGNSGAWAENLSELEAQLPSGFPELASDRGFTSLVDDLMNEPEAEELINRLRQQPLQSAAEPAAPQPEPYAPGYQSYPVPQAYQPYQGMHAPQGLNAPQGMQAYPPYQSYPPLPPEPTGTADGSRGRTAPALEGMHILWIDDSPDTVELDVRALRRAGASVEVVEDRAEAERRLAGEDHDLLISDITRGADREGGFKDVEGLARGNFYTGPVIFYTGRVTPAREARAEELGAGITASPDMLQRLVARVAAGRDSRVDPQAQSQSPSQVPSQAQTPPA
ncbi:P-loop NTPase fold protein [Streptomyces marispadix]|uniref:P-loop NTPase fold protein n=1 Tax=Streptomyces marispadix TaxID=2922868 RepID=A0ABS9T399_9ACTN|nr:P-loop NTPase fold protein [Streptomyces marispadix]MCH6162999.1 P-loop NTPase fold protein [Streptomyces marispadix]